MAKSPIRVGPCSHSLSSRFGKKQKNWKDENCHVSIMTFGIEKSLVLGTRSRDTVREFQAPFKEINLIKIRREGRMKTRGYETVIAWAVEKRENRAKASSRVREADGRFQGVLTVFKTGTLRKIVLEVLEDSTWTGKYLLIPCTTRRPKHPLTSDLEP